MSVAVGRGDEVATQVFASVGEQELAAGILVLIGGAPVKRKSFEEHVDSPDHNLKPHPALDVVENLALQWLLHYPREHWEKGPQRSLLGRRCQAQAPCTATPRL